MDINIIYNNDCKNGLKNLPDNSIDCCVTSPPYYGLRDYGANEQIGLEDTPEEYIDRLVGVFMEVYRVLKPTGTLWINIGDSYWSGKGYTRPTDKKHEFIKPKDLIGIPWILAFALRREGWYLRQDIIWHKPNAMPESVKDRCGKSHEYIFLLSKSANYYFDKEAIQIPAKPNMNPAAYRIGGNKRTEVDTTDPIYRRNTDRTFTPTEKVNKRDVWSVPTKPNKENHFAVFPDTLIVDCIKAGCPEGGVVLDPFMGSGTTAIVARKLYRNYIGFELNPEYVAISNDKINRELGVFR
jgi:DNA modification methylase